MVFTPKYYCSTAPMFNHLYFKIKCLRVIGKFYFVFPQFILYNSNKYYDKINDSCSYEWLIFGPFRLCVCAYVANKLNL